MDERNGIAIKNTLEMKYVEKKLNILGIPSEKKR